MSKVNFSISLLFHKWEGGVLISIHVLYHQIFARLIKSPLVNVIRTMYIVYINFMIFISGITVYIKSLTGNGRLQSS